MFLLKNKRTHRYHVEKRKKKGNTSEVVVKNANGSFLRLIAKNLNNGVPYILCELLDEQKLEGVPATPCHQFDKMCLSNDNVDRDEIVEKSDVTNEHIIFLSNDNVSHHETVDTLDIAEYSSTSRDEINDLSAILGNVEIDNIGLTMLENGIHIINPESTEVKANDGFHEFKETVANNVDEYSINMIHNYLKESEVTNCKQLDNHETEMSQTDKIDLFGIQAANDHVSLWHCKVPPAQSELTAAKSRDDPHEFEQTPNCEANGNSVNIEDNNTPTHSNTDSEVTNCEILSTIVEEMIKFDEIDQNDIETVNDHVPIAYPRVPPHQSVLERADEYCHEGNPMVISIRDKDTANTVNNAVQEYVTNVTNSDDLNNNLPNEYTGNTVNTAVRDSKVTDSDELNNNLPDGYTENTVYYAVQDSKVADSDELNTDLPEKSQTKGIIVTSIQTLKDPVLLPYRQVSYKESVLITAKAGHSRQGSQKSVNHDVEENREETNVQGDENHLLESANFEELSDNVSEISDSDGISTITELDELDNGMISDVDNNFVDPEKQLASPETVRGSQDTSIDHTEFNSFQAIQVNSANVAGNQSNQNETSNVSLTQIDTSGVLESSYRPTDDDDSMLERSGEPDYNEQTSPRRSFETSDATITRGAKDDADMFVAPSNSKSKKNFCYYCKTLQTVISRHLENVHRNEAEVKKFVVLPKGNPERRKIIETLRGRGNYLFNTDAAHNTGELLVARRPNIRMNRVPGDYSICHNCRISFSKSSIRRHRQRCIGIDSTHSRTFTVLSRVIAGRLHGAADPQLRETVFPVMREDTIVKLIRYDELLIIFGNKLAKLYTLQNQHDMIRSRLRLLGRLLQDVKTLRPEIKSFSEIYRPKHYDTVVAAIKKVAKFDEKTQTYGTPSNATCLGTYISKVGKCFITQCIKREDKDAKELAEDFLKIHEEEFCAQISKHAVEIQLERTRKNKKQLPLNTDVVKLYDFLEDKRRTYHASLSNKFSYEVWLKLLQVMLISVQLFNRKRAGEIERLLIEDLYRYEKLDKESDPNWYHTLDDEEKEMTETYVRVVIRGKLGRNVPFLTSMESLETLMLLLKFRPLPCSAKQVNRPLNDREQKKTLVEQSKVKVHSENPFVFGIPGYDHGRFKHLRATNLMRHFAQECGAEFPERLTGTNLRKHMATQCASKDVDETKIHNVAKFLGHSEAIHRRIYRQPTAYHDVCTISKVLENAVGLNNSDDPEDIAAKEGDTKKKKAPKKKKQQICHESSSDSDENEKTSTQLQKTSKCKNTRSGNGTALETKRRYESSTDCDEDEQTPPQSPQKRRRVARPSDTYTSDSEIDDPPEKKPKGKNPIILPKIRWTEEEKSVTLTAFKHYINNYKLPSSTELREHKQKNPCVKRTIDQIRTWISNQIRNKKNR